MMDKKRLVRDMENAKLGGVCAGIANYFEIDVTLVRLLWVLLVLFAGTGVLAYFICWIIMPEGWLERGFAALFLVIFLF